ncbi:hypothetical protein MTO96_051492 [Rhipicephalus appendiculatus]
MGCLFSCCEITVDQCENTELYGVMPRPGAVHNYLSTSIDSMPLLPPLGRSARRGIPTPNQPSGDSSPSGSRSPARPSQVPRSPQRLSPKRRSPRRLPPSAAIPIRNPEEPGPSQASVAGSPQLHSPLSPSNYSKSELVQLALLRQIEVSPQGVVFTVPRMGTIFEESTETEQDSAVGCRTSQNETAGSGQETIFPLFGEETRLDAPDEA